MGSGPHRCQSLQKCIENNTETASADVVVPYGVK